MVTRPRRRTRRLQCDVSGATLTEIEGPGTSSGAYGRGGGGAGGRAGGRDRARDERKEGSPPVSGGGDGRGAVTLPTRPPPGIATIFLSPGILSFPSFSFSRFFPVANPLGGGASRSREAAGEGRRNHQRGTGQISAKTGVRWLLDRADGHGDFNHSAVSSLVLVRSPSLFSQSISQSVSQSVFSQSTRPSLVRVL